MREIGTMWQIGVLTEKPCTFLSQNGSFSAFWHYKNKERFSRRLNVKWHISSTCLDFGGGGGMQFYGQNDFMDIWAFLNFPKR